jgi:hypothetical protein
LCFPALILLTLGANAKCSLALNSSEHRDLASEPERATVNTGPLDLERQEVALQLIEKRSKSAYVLDRKHNSNKTEHRTGVVSGM